MRQLKRNATVVLLIWSCQIPSAGAGLREHLRGLLLRLNVPECILHWLPLKGERRNQTPDSKLSKDISNVPVSDRHILSEIDSWFAQAKSTRDLELLNEVIQLYVDGIFSGPTVIDSISYFYKVGIDHFSINRYKSTELQSYSFADNTSYDSVYIELKLSNGSEGRVLIFRQAESEQTVESDPPFLKRKDLRPIYQSIYIPGNPGEVLRYSLVNGDYVKTEPLEEKHGLAEPARFIELSLKEGILTQVSSETFKAD